MKKSHAFSLAEVLTTLMIIGVIAAFLIPVLTTGIEKQKTVSMLKRLYSSFSVNIQTVLGEANCSSVSCLRAYPSGEVSYAEKDIVVDDVDEEGNITGNHKEYRQTKGHVFANPKYFHIISECKSCFAADSILPIGEYDDYKTFRLNNGATMSLYNFPDGNCTHTGARDKNGKVYEGDRLKELCGIVVFDVNGTKGPNMPGKDRFAYYITDEAVLDNYIIPIGYNHANIRDTEYSSGLTVEDKANCDAKVGNARGYNCTAKIMQDNWKIKY